MLKPSDQTLSRKMAYRLFGLDKLDQLYASLPHSGSAEKLIENLMTKQDIKLDISTPCSEDVEKGPLLVVANHPCGIVDGLLLLKFLLNKRMDVKLLANQILLKFPELSDVLLGMVPYSGTSSIRNNQRSLREAQQWLSDGHCLACFPAGNVSRLQLSGFPGLTIEDDAWADQVVRLARSIRLKGDELLRVLPVYINARNHWSFYFTGLFGRNAHSLLYVNEFLAKSGKNLEMIVGNPIAAEELEQMSAQAATDYLRFCVYGKEKHR